ncbi:hypothetical protein GIB67_034014 [Kingdonia uniflora]|uniref:Uncharacterized protein n=1 Tax=Kingdonia uniflora TaxID=39325 RepID=A0A7J7M620_9MAGN|nr:hypothetical protein GIB67_034014 [Kingdonia uniflora]
MTSISGCAKVDEADLVGHLSPIIGVGDEEDTVAELIEWPCLKGSRVEDNFFRTCSVSQEGDYLYFLPDLAKEKKCRRLGDEVPLEYVQGVVKDSRTDGFCCYLAQFDYGLTLPLSNLAKSVMNLIGVCPAQLNYNFWEVIFVCETLNGRWATSGSEERITAKDFLEYYAVKYVTATNGAYLCSSFARPCFFDLSSVGRVWNKNLLWVSGECLQRSYEEPLKLNNRTITKGINCKVSRKESFIDVVAREGTELEAVLKDLEISRFERVASKDDKVRRSQAKRILAGKTPGSMEEKLTTSKLNIPLKLARLNEIPDGPVDMATVSSTVVRNLAKRKAVKRGAAPHSVSSVSEDDSSKKRKVISPMKSQEMLEESDKIAEGTDLRTRFEVEADLLKEQCRAKAREKMVAVMDDEFKKLRYTKAEITAFSEGNYEEMEIMDEEEVEEREGGLSTAEKTDVDNQETINQKVLDTARERKEHTLLYNAEYAEEYEALISQYEDRLDDNVKISLQLDEAKKQVEEKTTTILSRDLTLNQLTSELTELKEKAASGSRHEAELAEYRIRTLNEEISDMKCNIRALNELLLKREIDLDTARTNLAVSEADFEKLSSSIVGKEAQSRANLVEIQAKNQNLVDDLTHACGNVRRATQREKEMNERINQLCARISKSERELRLRKLKYQKDLKFELDKRDCEIASG